MTEANFKAWARHIRATGLSPRGGFHVGEQDDVPATPGAGEGRTLVLIGNTGSGFWPVFRASPEYADGRPHPLDRFSERVIAELGARLDARPLFPFHGPPFHPFQRWARRAESLFPSPLGTLIHPDYGLWHAYRGALLVDRLLTGLPRPADAESPCLSCVEQPCLHTCPVGAFSSDGFDAAACASHLSTPNRCDEQGCRARNACPAGRPFRYSRSQHVFHLAAFRRARNAENDDSA